MKPSRLKVEQCEGKWNKIFILIFSVDLKWILKMEFFMTKDMQMQGIQMDWKAPKTIQVKSLMWQTPLYIYKQ